MSFDAKMAEFDDNAEAVLDGFGEYSTPAQWDAGCAAIMKIRSLFFTEAYLNDNLRKSLAKMEVEAQKIEHLHRSLSDTE